MFQSSKKLKLSKTTRYRQRISASAVAHKLFNTSSSSSSIESIPNLKETEFIYNQNAAVNNHSSGSSDLNNFDGYSSNYELATSSSHNNSYNFSSDSYQFSNTADNPSIFLSNWALRHSIPHTVLNDLLMFLRTLPGLNNLPKDARTLLKTPTTTLIKSIHGGEYHHLGLNREIKSLLLSGIDIPLTLELTVGIDGLPLTTNPSSQLWPILGCFTNINVNNRQNVFMIGAFYGKSKPGDSNEYLREFVDELKQITNEGIVYKDKVVKLKMHALICDAPAKAFVLKIRGHNGKNSCPRCIGQGIWSKTHTRTYFPNLDSPLRTHNSFINLEDKTLHLGRTILTEIPNFDLINDTPFDVMHVIYIGVVKKLISLWVGSPKHNKSLPSNLISVLDDKLNFLGKNIPVEFQRKPNKNSRIHPLRDVSRWKATELRQCLLYTGLVVFKDIVSNDIYNNFLELSIGVRLILSNNVSHEYNTYAKNILKHFVIMFGQIYGASYISHNIHSVIHLADDAKRYNGLNKICAFMFENHMQPLKKDIRSGMRPLQQLSRRYEEKRVSNVMISYKQYQTQIGSINCYYSNKNKLRPMVGNAIEPQYTGWRMKTLSIKLNEADKCVKILNTGEFVVIENIATDRTDKSKILIVGRHYEKMIDFFIQPCKSSLLGIYKASSLGPLKTWPLNNISQKIVSLPLNDYENSVLLIPFLH